MSDVQAYPGPGEPPCVVVGGGLAGSLMAIYMARRGHPVEVYEARPDMRRLQVDRGRSINLALSTRGLHALAAVGLEDEVRQMCIPMHGRMIHPMEGEPHLQPYGRAGQYINSISRQGLNELLMNTAEARDQVRFHFDIPCVDVDLDEGVAHFDDREKGERVVREASILIGADGAYSAVRQRLQRSGRYNYEQAYLSHGYKELSIPAGPQGKYLIEKNALHIWPRHDFMLIALPNLDATFTVTLFMAFEGATSFEALKTPADVEAFFKREFPDAYALMPTLTDDFFANPTGSLVTIRCAPYHHGERVMILGDAAHAVVPFYGQGMNAAFEDCFVLNELLEREDGDVGRAIAAFSRERKDDADAIGHLALYNYFEMRSAVASPYFVFRKKIERVLHRLFPEWWIPLYTMVTFTNMPYALARERAARQDRLLTLGLGAAAALACVTLAALMMGVLG
ncbi:kynurenine 3-monooxygenase [Lujinxingia litoralis]|uniref:Kynurenine 3-monooxygenase n=1 Tax=Lujinxingia litoralis TaxID=2211119 RepID=A0A328CAS7_9DELT|nr:NAD(P)/FAD-dependent oxidoreductase [Lujinxingia litoralis]RAL22307.1 kynurenine 3-monooxygenase [Lujinxingia litoralis]